MPSLLPPEALSDVQIVFAAGPELSARAVFGGTGGLAPCSDQSTFATGLSCLCPNVVKKKAVLGVLPSGIPHRHREPHSRAPGPGRISRQIELVRVLQAVAGPHVSVHL